MARRPAVSDKEGSIVVALVRAMGSLLNAPQPKIDAAVDAVNKELGQDADAKGPPPRVPPGPND